MMHGQTHIKFVSYNVCLACVIVRLLDRCEFDFVINHTHCF